MTWRRYCASKTWSENKSVEEKVLGFETEGLRSEEQAASRRRCFVWGRKRIADLVRMTEGSTKIELSERWWSGDGMKDSTDLGIAGTLVAETKLLQSVSKRERLYGLRPKQQQTTDQPLCGKNCRVWTVLRLWGGNYGSTTTTTDLRWKQKPMQNDCWNQSR